MDAAESRSELLKRITIDAGKCGGRPCVRGMRICVIDVLGWLEAGMTRQEILADYPELEDADITACLAFAGRQVEPVRAA